MQLDTFQYPIDQGLIQIHRRATRIGKNRDYIHEYIFNQNVLRNHQTCLHCGRIASQCPKFRCCESQQQIQRRYGVYGPTPVIYLGLIKKLAIFTILCIVIIALPLLILNLHGSLCNSPFACKNNDIVHRWSIYNVMGAEPGSLPHTCIWLFFCIIFIAFLIYLKIYNRRTYRRIDNRNTTDSDYCILITRLPDDARPEQILQLISHILGQNQSEGTRTQLQGSQITNIIMINDQDERIEAYEDQVDKFKRAAKIGQQSNFVPSPLPKSTKFANAALVRFYDKFTKYRVLQTVENPFIEKFLRYLCVFYSPKSQYMIRGQRISIQTAPHPTDIFWQNFSFSQRNRLTRKTLINLLVIVILFISSGVSLTISYFIQKATNLQSSSILLTILVVISTLIFNQIMKAIVKTLTRRMRMETRTDLQRQQLGLIVIHQSLNLGFFSIIAPIIVKLPNMVQEQRIQSSNFPLVMLTTIIVQAIVANIAMFFFDFCQGRQIFKRCLHKMRCGLKTQTQAYQAFQGLQIPFVSGYSFVVKLVWFGFIYGVVTPISIPISAIGILMYYFFEKILYNHKYSIPYYSGKRISDQFIDLLDWAPLLIGLFNLYLYLTTQSLRGFPNQVSIIVLIAIMIDLGVMNVLLPWDKILKRCFAAQEPQNNLLFNPKNLQLTYQESNSQIRQTPNIFHRQQSYILGNQAYMNQFTPGAVDIQNNPNMIYTVQQPVLNPGIPNNLQYNGGTNNIIKSPVQLWSDRDKFSDRRVVN